MVTLDPAFASEAPDLGPSPMEADLHPPLWRIGVRQRNAIIAVLILLAVHGNLSIFGGTAKFGAMGFFSRRGMSAIIWSIGAYATYPHWNRLVARAFQDKLISVFAVLAVLSVLWSHPRFPSLNSIFLVATTLFAFFLDDAFNVEEQHSLMSRTAWICSIMSLLTAFLLPSLGLDQVADPGALQGIFVGKNVCALAFVFFLMAALTRRCRNWLEYINKAGLVLTILLLIVMTRSRTAWAVVALMFAFYAMLRMLNRFSPGARLTLLLFLLGPLVLLSAYAAINMNEILAGMGRNATLSGRVPLWNAILVSGAKQPWLGYGYQAFWAAGMRNEATGIFLQIGWKPGYAHNGILEVYLWFGLVGVTLLLLFLLRTIKDAVQCVLHQRDGRLNWYVLIVFVSLIYNLDEAFFGAVNQLAWVLLLVASMRLRREAQLFRVPLATNASAFGGAGSGVSI